MADPRVSPFLLILQQVGRACTHPVESPFGSWSNLGFGASLISGKPELEKDREWMLS